MTKKIVTLKSLQEGEHYIDKDGNELLTTRSGVVIRDVDILDKLNKLEDKGLHKVRIMPSGKIDHTHFSGTNLAGRPKGIKNKETLFREIIKEGFEKKMLVNFQQVLEVVIEKAKDGDMVAAKMLFDRVLPVTKAIDINEMTGGKNFSISINIGSLEDEMKVIN